MTKAAIAPAVLGFVLAFISLTASAVGVPVSWVNPTGREDGSSLPVAELRGTRIEHGTCNGTLFGTKNGEVLAAAGTTAGTLQLPAGIHCIRLFAIADNKIGGTIDSSPTNPINKPIAASPPNPPSNVIVQELTAFTVVKSQDRLVMLPVGTVPGDTACIGSQVVVTDGVTYHAVPTNAVTFSGSVRPVVVFARCS